jgi:hypothetical protein
MALSTGTPPRGGSRTFPGATASSGTAFTRGIDPWPGPKGRSLLYGVDGAGNPNWYGGQNAIGYFSKITYLSVLSGSTAHTWYALRPLNWAVVSVAGAKNTTAFTLATNPGLYSTAFHYPVATGVVTPGANGVVYGPPVNVADLTPTTTHYYAVQLADGTWFYDLIAAFSTSTLVVTTTATIPNVTGGGIPKGAIFFLLGSGTTVDPNTGVVPPVFYPPASAITNFAEGSGVCNSIHPGDPMMVLNANATAASFLNAVTVSYDQ